METLYSAMLAYQPVDGNPLGKLADLLRTTRGSIEIVVASEEIVRIAGVVRTAPIRQLGPVLGMIRQEADNRWVEYESSGGRVGLVIGRHPQNPAVIEFTHIGQRAGSAEVGLLRGGVRWLGLPDAGTPDWAAIASGLKTPALPEPEADSAWARRIDASIQITGAFGQILEESQLPAVTAVLLQDLALLAVLSSGIAERRPVDGTASA